MLLPAGTARGGRGRATARQCDDTKGGQRILVPCGPVCGRAWATVELERALGEGAAPFGLYVDEELIVYGCTPRTRRDARRSRGRRANRFEHCGSVPGSVECWYDASVPELEFEREQTTGRQRRQGQGHAPEWLFLLDKLSAIKYRDERRARLAPFLPSSSFYLFVAMR